jgi:hypothetical protein
MKASRTNGILSILTAVGLCLSSPRLAAEVRTFVIDQTQSTLTIGGSFVSLPLQQQAPGSLTTRYTGTIFADVSGSTITFVGGSTILALTNGVWQPNTNGTAGSAPANYGGQGSLPPFLSGRAALRDIVLDAISGALTVTGTNFPAAGITFSFPSNAPSALDYTYSGLTSGSGRRPLRGDSTNNVATTGSLSSQGGNLVLTIPANLLAYATINTSNDVQYSLQGQLVAVATTPLQVSAIQISAGQLNFTITTISNQSYTILGSTNLLDWSSTNDQFIATSNVTKRTISLPGLPRQFYRIRKD